MTTSSSYHRSPWIFFALVFAIAAPFWALGALTFLSPTIAVLLLIYCEGTLRGVRR
jgi:hypothetical protein